MAFGNILPPVAELFLYSCWKIRDDEIVRRMAFIIEGALSFDEINRIIFYCDSEIGSSNPFISQWAASFYVLVNYIFYLGSL